jgi:galactose oxidase
VARCGLTHGSTLTSMAPTSPNLAPRGPYMLFLLNDKGVPSVAKIVMVKN